MFLLCKSFRKMKSFLKQLHADETVREDDKIGVSESGVSESCPERREFRSCDCSGFLAA